MLPADITVALSSAMYPANSRHKVAPRLRRSAPQAQAKARLRCSTMLDSFIRSTLPHLRRPSILSLFLAASLLAFQRPLLSTGRPHWAVHGVSVSRVPVYLASRPLLVSVFAYTPSLVLSRVFRLYIPTSLVSDSACLDSFQPPVFDCFVDQSRFCKFHVPPSHFSVVPILDRPHLSGLNVALLIANPLNIALPESGTRRHAKAAPGLAGLSEPAVAHMLRALPVHL